MSGEQYFVFYLWGSVLNQDRMGWSYD